MKPKRKLFLAASLLVLLITLLFGSMDPVRVIAFQQILQTPFYLPLIHGPIAATITNTPDPRVTPSRTVTVSTTVAPTRSVTVPSGMILVDHTSIDLFDDIPNDYLTDARNLRTVFLDRSVGGNISEGLSCLGSASNWADTTNACRRDYYDISGTTWLWRSFNQTDFNSGNVPPSILFDPDPVKYNRSNWTYIFYQEASWEDLVAYFNNTVVANNVGSKDVLSFEFSYLTVSEDSNIASSENGFFVDQPHNGYYPTRERWDISDFEALMDRYPNKIFFLWTTSLARTIGTPESVEFNDQMRDYAIQNTIPLLDVADILSHDPNGNPCYDNRDGVQYCNSNGCENNANDGQNIPAICQAYTTETDGGHLCSVSGGQIRVAKAFWVLMAQIAGWNP